LGYEFDTLPVRLEAAYRWFGEAEYKWDELYENGPLETAKGTIESQAVMFNGFFDWRNSTRLTPFIGAGIGYYFNRSNFNRTEANNLSTVETTEHKNGGLAWSASAGFTYNIGPNWFLDLRAEYLSLGHVDFYETNPSSSVSPGEQELMKTDRFAAISGLLSLTYKFDLDQY
jgi:opacity protein-like surface antigen